MTQIFLNTFSLAAAYSLLAVGFVLVLNATGAVNLAHGSFVVVGGFIAASIGSAFNLPGILVLPFVFRRDGVDRRCARADRLLSRCVTGLPFPS